MKATAKMPGGRNSSIVLRRRETNEWSVEFIVHCDVVHWVHVLTESIAHRFSLHSGGPLGLYVSTME